MMASGHLDGAEAPRRDLEAPWKKILLERTEARSAKPTKMVENGSAPE
jgi:hypothetical protein